MCDAGLNTCPCKILYNKYHDKLVVHFKRAYIVTLSDMYTRHKQDPL